MSSSSSSAAVTTTVTTVPPSAFTPVGRCKTNKCDTCQNIVHPLHIRHKSGVNTCNKCIVARKSEAPEEPKPRPAKTKTKTKGKATKRNNTNLFLGFVRRAAYANNTETPLAFLVMRKFLLKHVEALKEAKNSPEYQLLTPGQRQCWLRQFEEEILNLRRAHEVMRWGLGAFFRKLSVKLAGKE